MKLLLAAMNRDLLTAYGKILTDRLGETVTVFDGTQILNMPEGEKYDAVIIDSRLPHSDYRMLAERFWRSGTPAVVIIYSAVGSDYLLDGSHVAEYLPLPFEPDDIVCAVEKSVRAYAGSKEGEYGLVSKIRQRSNLTVSESEILEKLAMGGYADSEREGAYITALNEKLRMIEEPGERWQMKYESKRGFKLVNGDE